MQRTLFSSLVFILLLGEVSISFASGGSGGGFGGRQNGGFDSRQRQRVVDQSYETGKSIYKGRKAGEPTLEYCVLVKGEKVPLKRKSIKSFKNTTYTDLATNLYQCDQPEKKISAGLTRDSFLYVLYYLNKRHKLDLKGA